VAAAEPPLHRGKRARVCYATGLGSSPPAVALFVHHPYHLTTAYLRYLENRLRAAFPLEGTPIRMMLRARPRTALRVRSSAARKNVTKANAEGRRRKAGRR